MVKQIIKTMRAPNMGCLMEFSARKAMAARERAGRGFHVVSEAYITQYFAKPLMRHVEISSIVERLCRPNCGYVAKDDTCPAFLEALSGAKAGGYVVLPVAYVEQFIIKPLEEFSK